MKRNALNRLIEWKEDEERKPLILKGARQVGKTWLMKEFGRTNYENFVYFNLDEEDYLESLFEIKNPIAIIVRFSWLAGQKIIPGKTLIIFDEIQECSNALNSLKYFCENANEYHIIAAGSLLGTLLSTPKSYPVGKADLLDIDPLTFDEFLQETDPNLYEYYIRIEKDQIIEEIFHRRLLEAYNTYLIIGGMPAAVASWVKYKDPSRIKKIQKGLLSLYENDISKHSGSINAGRILLVFRKIVSQLDKQNEKFVYGAVKEGARARDFEEAIEWLVSSGIATRALNVSKPQHPLNAYEKLSEFKLFFFDTGLLNKKAAVANAAMLTGKDFQFKRPLTENYVLQQLKGQFESEPHYYAQKNGEIDFVIQYGSEIIPVEVKAGEDKSAPSFKRNISLYDPQHANRKSKRNYRKD